MNETEKITQWVEYKIGKFLTLDIENKVVSEECNFDIDKYSNEIFEKYFGDDADMNRLKCEITYDTLQLDTDDVCLTDDFSQDSSDDDFRSLSLDSIIRALQSAAENTQIKALESLAACSAEEMVAHSSWTVARKLLQDLIKVPKSRKVSEQVLQLFRRFLLSKDTPKVVCEGFVSLAESIAFSIDAFNQQRNKELTQEMYDIKTSGWAENNLVGTKGDGKNYVEVIFKSMWLLVKSQNGIPYKWIRFNDKRLREIVFSFIHMISSTKNFKNDDYLGGLKVLAVLDPRATWCVNWCHGATGRLLLCSALKTNKKLFNEIVNFVLIRMKFKDSDKMENQIKSNFTTRLPPLNECGNLKIRSKSDNLNVLGKKSKKNIYESKEKYSGRLFAKDHIEFKGNRSAPPYPANERLHYDTINKANEEDWIIKGIAKQVVDEAMFCHCLSIVVYLIQYRSGRSLFPMEVTCRRRRITIPDFTLTVINYINGIVFFSGRTTTTDEYKEHMLKLVEILKPLQTKMF